jgi:hypothetical protein
MRTTFLICEKCRCFLKTELREGALLEEHAGVCVRFPPQATGASSWARYPVVGKASGCFEGIAKAKEQLVADTLMGNNG